MKHTLLKTLLFLVPILPDLLLGCASSSGVQSHGADTYRVEGASEFGLDQAKNTAFEDASRFCSKSGKPVNEVSSRTGSRVDSLGDQIQTFELVFQCGGAPRQVYADQPSTQSTQPSQPSTQSPQPSQPSTPPPPPIYDQPDPATQAKQQYQALCAGGGAPMEALRACKAALQTGRMSQPEVANNYFNQALIFAGMGDFKNGIWALDQVLRIAPNDRKAHRLRAEFVQAATPRTFAVYYEGLFCAGVPKDSIALPAAEIFLITAVVPAGNPDAAARSTHPGSGSYYPNVKPGFKTAPHSPIWVGTDRQVYLTASLWEHDADGAQIEAVSMQVLKVAISVVGRAPAGQPTGNQPAPSGNISDKLFGTGHDVLGAVQFSVIDLAYVAAQPKRNYAGIPYHFVSSHKQGGADCRVYFGVERR